MSKLAELLAELKALQPAYDEADKRAMNSEVWDDELQDTKTVWSDSDWELNKRYWAIAESFVAELRSVVDGGATVRISVEGEDLEVRSVGRNCWQFGGHPFVKYASAPNAEYLYVGFRLDFVESLEVLNRG